MTQPAHEEYNKLHIDTVDVSFNQIDALRKENEELRKQLEWQDISTAPRDGTKILCCGLKDGEWIYAVDFYRNYVKHGYEGWGKFNPKSFPALFWKHLDPPATKGDE